MTSNAQLTSVFLPPVKGVFPPGVQLAIIATPAWTGRIPTYLTWSYQPEFNAEIIRVGDATAMSSGGNRIRHFYAKTQPWNCDGTKMLLNFDAARAFVLDGNTYALLNVIDLTGTNLVTDGISGTCDDAKWSNTKPNVIYSTVGNTLISIDATTGAHTTLHTFAAYTLVSNGYQEGNQSDDDRYFTIMGKTAGGNYTLAVYDLWHDSVSSGSFNLTTLGGDVTDIDWFGMSHSGLYVGILYNTLHKFSVFDNNMTFLRDLWTNNHDHGDFGWDQSGAEVFVALYEDSTNNYIESWPLSGAPKTRNLTTQWTGDMHISGRANKRPGWIYVSSYRLGAGLGFEKEVAAVKLDASGTMEHFAHSRNSNTSGTGYATEACPDRAGARVIFASDWGVVTGPYYSYVAANQSYPRRLL